jgi:hypothetical protein
LSVGIVRPCSRVAPHGAGRNASVQDGVPGALGRRPWKFGDYVRATAASAIWTPDATEWQRSQILIDLFSQARMKEKKRQRQCHTYSLPTKIESAYR